MHAHREVNCVLRELAAAITVVFSSRWRASCGWPRRPRSSGWSRNRCPDVEAARALSGSRCLSGVTRVC